MNELGDAARLVERGPHGVAAIEGDGQQLGDAGEQGVAGEVALQVEQVGGDLRGEARGAVGLVEEAEVQGHQLRPARPRTSAIV